MKEVTKLACVALAAGLTDLTAAADGAHSTPFQEVAPLI